MTTFSRRAMRWRRKRPRDAAAVTTTTRRGEKRGCRRTDEGTATATDERRRGHATATAAPPLVASRTRGYEVAGPPPARELAREIADHRDASRRRHPRRERGERRQRGDEGPLGPQRHDANGRRPSRDARQRQPRQRRFFGRDDERRQQRSFFGGDHQHHRHCGDRDWQSNGSHRQGPSCENRENRYDGSAKRHEQGRRPASSRPRTVAVVPMKARASTQKREPAPVACNSKNDRQNIYEGTAKRHEQERRPSSSRPLTSEAPQIIPASTPKSEPAREIKRQTTEPEETEPLDPTQRGCNAAQASTGLSVTSLLSKWGSKKASRATTAEATRRRASDESSSSATALRSPGSITHTTTIATNPRIESLAPAPAHKPDDPSHVKLVKSPRSYATTTTITNDPRMEPHTPVPPEQPKKSIDGVSCDELPPPPPGHKKHKRPRPQPAAIPDSVRVRPQSHMPKAVPQVSSPDHTAADHANCHSSGFASSPGVPPYPVSVSSASTPDDSSSDFALLTEPHLSPVATREVEHAPVKADGKDLSMEEDTSPKNPTTESKERESSSDSGSSDDSDTDEEEVMQWASKMFGINRIEEEKHDGSNEGEEFDGEQRHGIYDLYYDNSTESNEWEQSRAEPVATEPEFLDYYEADDEEIAERRRIREKKKAKKLRKEQRRREKRMSERQRQQQNQIDPDDDGYIYGETGGEAIVDPDEEARRRRKKTKKLKKLLQQQYILAGPTEADFERERQYKEEVKRKRESAKPLTAAQVRAILADDAGEHGQTNWVRRSSRQPCRSILNSKQLRYFLDKLRGNHPDMVVLKMKKYINDPNAPRSLLDAALEALEENTNCESLYIQNFNEGMRDKQVRHLIKILQQPSCNIWCLNIGETYNVSTKTWRAFTRGLKKTKITHMYASEHTITSEMKDEIRDTIRNNRQKHDRHINPDNLDVIIQCTHCWWNPINAKALRSYVRTRGYGHILDDAEAQGMRGSTSAAPTK